MSQDNAEEGNNDRLIAQMIRTITPELLNASRRVAAEVSRSTLAEIEALNDLQATRRKRDQEVFSFDGNREQHMHASEVMSILEKTDRHMQTESWDKAKATIAQGKQILTERMKSIRLADNADWGTVKVFNSGSVLGLNEDESKRWKEALKSRKNRPIKRERDSDSDHTFRPYQLPSSSRSRRRPSPQSNREPPICFKCHQRGHISYDCWKKDRY